VDSVEHAPLSSVFLGWAGDASHYVAKALKYWLPAVAPGLKTWVSSEDLRPGARWSNELLQILKEVDGGILCLTPWNIGSPWLHFEAGALLRTVESDRIIPYAIGVKSADIRGPVGEFQAASADRHGTLSLVQTLRGGVRPDHKLFNALWPFLEGVVEHAQFERPHPDISEYLVEKVRRASVAKASVQIEKVIVPTTSIQPGSTIEMGFIVTCHRDAHGVQVWLGAGINIGEAQVIFNLHEDASVQLLAGTRRYERKFSIPQNMVPGTYTMNADVWLGPTSDSDNSFPLASLWPMPNRITVS
jgi:hypothetical protein